MGGKHTCTKRVIKLAPGPLYRYRHASCDATLACGLCVMIYVQSPIDNYSYKISASSNVGNPTNVKNVNSHSRNPPRYLISMVRRSESLLSTILFFHLLRKKSAQNVPHRRRTWALWKRQPHNQLHHDRWSKLEGESTCSAAYVVTTAKLHPFVWHQIQLAEIFPEAKRLTINKGKFDVNDGGKIFRQTSQFTINGGEFNGSGHPNDPRRMYLSQL